MRKPKSRIMLTGIIFLILGVIFSLFAVLSRAGLMKMSPNSQGDPGVIFLILGAAFLAVGILLCVPASLSAKRKAALLRDGMQLTGRVVSVQHLITVTYGNQRDPASHPYVVYVEYEVDGIRYKGKSALLWEHPSVHEGDGIAVFIDPEKPKRCAVKL